MGPSLRPVVVAVLVLAAWCAPAQAITYAPVDRPGPALQVAPKLLQDSLACPQDPATASRDVVLLIPGTTVTPEESFDWNYELAFKDLGIPYCTVTLPQTTNGDIQVAAEYVVSAVRTISAASHRRVVMLGWSQGASTLPRWALRFWPDIRAQTASLVQLAPLNQIGSPVANGPCVSGSCVPAAWQQSIGSQFMAALNSGQQTFGEIAYTAIYTRFDDVVAPDVTGALSVLPEGPNVTNLAIQDLCPTETTDHLTIIASPTAYAAAMDAIAHPGRPANLADVHPVSCVAGQQPYVTPESLLRNEQRLATPIPGRLTTGTVPHEPDLGCYVTAACPETTQAPAPTARCTSRRRFRIHLTVPRGERLRSARVTVDGRRVPVVGGRRPSAVVDLRGKATRATVVRIVVRTRSGRTISSARRYRLCVPGPA